MHTLQLMLSFVVFGLFFSIIFGLTLGKDVEGEDWHLPQSQRVWIYLLGLSTFGTIAHAMFNYAARIAPAGLGAIARSSNLIWTYAFEMLVFHHVPTFTTAIGVVLVFISLTIITMTKISDEKSAMSPPLPIQLLTARVRPRGLPLAHGSGMGTWNTSLR